MRSPSQAIGKGFHRSGWDRVVKALDEIQEPNGILLDDFIEQNFCYASEPVVYKKPWIGIFHHPSDVPHFSNHNEKLSVVLKSSAFIESAKHLKMAISLSEDLAVFLRKHLDCKVVTIKHPTFFEFPEWSLDAYKANTCKKLIQIGFYLRNSRLISQIPDVNNHKKVKIVSSQAWTKTYDRRVRKYWKNLGTRPTYRPYYNMNMVTPHVYDKLLSNNIVVVEYFNVSASNTLLDCVSRNTPIIVSRNAAVVEYLGPNYPLYFDSPAEIPNLVKRAEEGHLYLKSMNKDDLNINHFISSVLENINE